MTEFTSVRIDVKTGERLPPTGIDPYSLPWVQGAASTVPRRTRMKYASQISDLREKLDVLRTKRKRSKSDDFEQLFGPRLRTPFFRGMQDRPLPAWPDESDGSR